MRGKRLRGKMHFNTIKNTFGFTKYKCFYYNISSILLLPLTFWCIACIINNLGDASPLTSPLTRLRIVCILSHLRNRAPLIVLLPFGSDRGRSPFSEPENTHSKYLKMILAHPGFLRVCK